MDRHTQTFLEENLEYWEKYIYVKMAGASFYSRLDIEILMGGLRDRGQLIITSWTNPSGSRNLKFDEEYQDYEYAWRDRLARLRYAATKLKGEVRDKYLVKYDLGDILGIKPNDSFDEALFQQEVDTLKEQLKKEGPRWWHALE